MQVTAKLVVKGTYYYKAEQTFENGSLVKGARLHLVHQPNNRYDSNAVEVHLKESGDMLGHISRQLAPKYSKLVNTNSILDASVFRVSRINDRIKVEIRIVYEQSDDEISKKHNTKYWISCSSLQPKPGVYGLKNINTGRMYVGSSNNVKERLINHLRELLHGCHSNYMLQSDFTRLGPDYFEAQLLAGNIALHKLSSSESREIAKLLNNGHELYNMTFDGQGTYKRTYDNSFEPQSVSDRKRWQYDDNYYDEEDNILEQRCPFCDANISKDNRLCSSCGVAFPRGIRVSSGYIVNGDMMYIYEDQEEDEETEVDEFVDAYYTDDYDEDYIDN